MSVLLALVSAIAPTKDLFSQWRHYQRFYVQLIRNRPDAARLERRFQSGIHQIWIPEQRVVDRCSTCHVGGQGVDTSKHDVGSHAMADLDKQFDTPSLHFIAGTAPYFHDGRYKDLHTLLTKSDGKMGHTKHLAPSDLSDLEAYLESL